MLDGINDYMDIHFTEDEMMEIYTYLGNACHHQRTIEFIKSGYDMMVLNGNVGFSEGGSCGKG